MTDEADEIQTDSPAECELCKARQGKLQALGLTIFVVSLCSCGTLTFVAIPAGFVIQMVALRKCKTCRTAARVATKMG